MDKRIAVRGEEERKRTGVEKERKGKSKEHS